MENLLDNLKSLLQKDERLVSEGELLKNKITELALRLDKDLIKLLLSDEKMKEVFFVDVDGVLIFDKDKFIKFVSNKQFLPDSYTAFKNKIGLIDENEEFISEKKEVVLSWPYKNLKYPEDFINKIICGDSLELIKSIPDNSIDVVITDPPYGLNKDGVRGDADLSLFYNILPECDRVLKDNSFFITFFSTKFLPQLFIHNPFNYFWQIVLYCPEGRVKSPIGYTKFMSCFIFKKGNPKIIYWNKDIFVDTPGKMVEPDEGFIDHPTPKPKHFIKEILKMFTKENDLILDPFIGSGSTAVACIQLNRRFIGFEIEERYYNLAVGRVNKFLSRFNSNSIKEGE